MAELLAPLVRDDPDRAAIVDDDGRVRTRRDLEENVHRLVDALRGCGLERGDTVALMVGNQIEAFEVALAAAHGGWCVVPVSWHLVAHELAYVLADSGARAVVVDRRWARVASAAVDELAETQPDAVSSLVARVVVGEADGGLPPGFVAYAELRANGSPDEPADQAGGGPMFYTSGTTGFPKGVRTALSRTDGPPGTFGFVAAAFLDVLRMPRDGVALLCGPVYHSAQFVFAMFPLVTGSTIVCQHRFDPARTLELIDTHRVTTAHLVPTQMLRLLKLDDDVRSRFDGSSLERVYHGAAPCPPEVKRALLDWWGPVVWEYYGGTEGGFLTTISAEEWRERPGSVGRATPLVELLVTDDQGRRLGPGETGQIWFRSLVGADFEYHNAPEKTDAAHLEHGVGTLGDVGHLDEEGYLFMSDRKIDMIISGGVNIYPAEIEGALVTHPAVLDAAVFGIPDDEMGEAVHAAVELDGVAPDDALWEELAAHVRERLAGLKVPRSWEAHDHLPRSEAGKLQKRALRDPHWEGAGRSI